MFWCCKNENKTLPNTNRNANHSESKMLRVNIKSESGNNEQNNIMLNNDDSMQSIQYSFKSDLRLSLSNVFSNLSNNNKNRNPSGLDYDSINENGINFNKKLLHKLHFDSFQTFYNMDTMERLDDDALIYKVKTNNECVFTLKKVIKDEYFNYNAIDVLSNIKNNGVMSLINYCETNENNNEIIYMVFEYYSGMNLYDYTRYRKCINEMECKAIIKQLSNVLSELHSYNIIHCDIKATNVMFKTEMCINIVLIDFDFVEYLNADNNYCVYKQKGTKIYCAPEILFANENDKIGYNCQIDLWSLGILLYFMLFYELPFYDKNPNILYDKIKNGSFKYPKKPKISNKCKDFINKLIVGDPNKRLNAKNVQKHSWFTS